VTRASDNQFPGIVIRESATDGSDFSNPAADYRRLFLGEDGQLHVKDSAGAVTDIGSGSGNVATDAIWDAAGDLAVGSGANTAAKLAIGAAGGAVSSVNGAVAWNSGTAFPTAATGDRFWRTDLGMECYYDGTRWLSTQVFTAEWRMWPSGAFSGTAAYYAPLAGHATGLAVWLLDAQVFYYASATTNGSHYHTLQWFAAGGAVVTFNMQTQTTDTWVNTAIGSSIAYASRASTYVLITKTGTPGGISVGSTLRYRVIAT
jgi:hypothetical protein